MYLDEKGRRVVEERVLLAWWRDRMEAWPTHQYRMRKDRVRGEGENDVVE